MSTVSTEYFTSERKATRRANELRQLTGNFKVAVIREGSEWAVRYWQES